MGSHSRMVLCACALVTALSLTGCGSSATPGGSSTETVAGPAVGDPNPKRGEWFCPTCGAPASPSGPTIVPAPEPQPTIVPAPEPQPTIVPAPETPTGPTDPQVPDPPVSTSEVSIEHHDGFDRVIYGFGGRGVPAWTAQYVGLATPRSRSVALMVTGQSILELYFFDDAPADGGPPVYAGPNPLGAPNSTVLTEVHLMPYFSVPGDIGSTQSFIGSKLDKPPFTVTTLDNPPRLAVDIYG